MTGSRAPSNGPALATRVGRTVAVIALAGVTLALCTTPAEPPTTSVVTPPTLRVEALVPDLDTPGIWPGGPTDRSG